MLDTHSREDSNSRLFDRKYEFVTLSSCSLCLSVEFKFFLSFFFLEQTRPTYQSECKLGEVGLGCRIVLKKLKKWTREMDWGRAYGGVPTF